MLSANQIKDIKEQAYVGAPSPFYDICEIYPYTVAQVVKMGNTKYNSYLGLLILDENEIAEGIKEKTGEEVPIEQIHPLEYLLQSAESNDMFLLDLQNAFNTFIKEEILLLPQINSVLVGEFSKKKLITEENFRDFQDILRIQNNKEITEPPPENESPFRREMRLKREKAERIKRKQQAKKGETIEFLDLMQIGDVFGIDKNTTSVFAYSKLIDRYRAKEKWDQDLQMLCAGADSSKIKTKYWGTSLDE